MADVRRGQIVVVAALLVAVVFVGLALVLNSAIYAENLASRDTGDETGDTLEQRHALEEDLGRTVDRTNAEVATTDGETLEGELRRAVENLSRTRSQAGAQRGASVEVRLSNPTEGTRLRQTDPARNFTSAGGDADWTLTDDVPSGGQFTLSIDRSSLFEATLDTTMALMAESAFALEFPTDSGTWRVYVFRGAATDSVYAVVETDDQRFRDSDLDDRTNPDHVVDGWLNQSCSMQGETVAVALSRAEFGGQHCAEFEFYDDIGAHGVRYANARTDGVDRAVGTYDVLAGTTEFNRSAFEPVGDGQPFYQSAIYAFEYGFTYRTSGGVYRSPDRTLEPGARDPGGILWEHPRITDLAVADRSDETAASFEVDWRVADADDALERVELRLVEVSYEKTESEVESDVERATDDPAFADVLDGLTFDGYFEDYTDTVGVPVNTNRTVAEETVRVDGASAAGSTTLSHDGAGTDYRVQVTVVDESGRASTRRMACEAGADDCREVR